MRVLLFIFISMQLGSILYAKNKINLAIVHSYENKFYWTNQIEKGFIKRITQEYEIEIVFKGELNAKNDPNGVKSRVSNIEKQLSKIKFDILFITDDDALNLIGQKFYNTKTKLIFAGINSPLKQFGSSDSEINKTIPKNVSGVLERYELLPLVKLINDLIDGSKNLILLFDKSATADGVFENFQEEVGINRKFGKMVIKQIIRSNDFHNWENAIKLAGKSDVLVIFPFSNVVRPKNLELNSTEKFADWISKTSNVPEFATASLFKNNDFFATVGIDPLEHGEDAAIAFLNSESEKYINQRILTKNYARLKLNPIKAQKLKVNIPFELFAYSYALSRKEKE